MRIALLIGLTICVGGLFGGCEPTDSNKPTDTYQSGTTLIYVDETMRPIIEAEIVAFEAQYPKAKIQAKYLPESEVFQSYNSDSCKMIIVSRKLSKDELQRVKESRKFTPRPTDFAKDGVVLLTHPANPDSQLTIAQIEGLLTGKYKNWSDLNPKNSTGPVQVVFDQSGSSLARFALDSITNGKPLGSNVYAAGSNLKVIDYVAQTPNTLGFIGYNWISDKDDPTVQQNLQKVKLTGVSKDGAKFYKLDKDIVYKIVMNRYPFKRTFYMIPREARNGLASGFASYVAGKDGQLIIHKSELVPTNSVIRLVEYKEGNLLE